MTWWSMLILLALGRNNCQPELYTTRPSLKQTNRTFHKGLVLWINRFDQKASCQSICALLPKPWSDLQKPHGSQPFHLDVCIGIPLERHTLRPGSHHKSKSRQAENSVSQPCQGDLPLTVKLGSYIFIIKLAQSLQFFFSLERFSGGVNIHSN